MEQETTKRIPHVVSEDELKITDDFSVRLYVLDDGRRIIDEDDMGDVLAFLGISQAEFEKMVTNKITFKQYGNNRNQR